ncbi:MAG: O-acetyl-ADP-ribose deacetylase [Chloroflexota bacterium]|nr:O-acetyl-ADP-ribose deacetylase [Chloroflexota bacterium]
MGNGTIRVAVGDITALDVDAIVNAANSHLAGGGGVDGAIHRAGGPAIKAETQRLFPGGCPTGEAVTTGGGDLRARWVIHAVGPVWRGGDQGEDEQLASAWRASLREAVEHGAASVAFPSISTGVYGFPVVRAGPIAVRELRDGLVAMPAGRELDVTICAFSERDAAVYRRAVEAMEPPGAV